MKSKERNAEKTMFRIIRLMNEDEVLDRIRNYDSVEEALEFWEELKDDYAEEIALFKKRLKEERKGVCSKEVYPEDSIYIFILAKLSDLDVEQDIMRNHWKCVLNALTRVEPKYRRVAKELSEILEYGFFSERTDEEFLEILKLY